MSEAPLTKESVQRLLQAGAAEPVPEETGSLIGAGLSRLQWAYLQAAAVLSYFSPAELLPAGASPSTAPDAMTPLMASSRFVPDREGRPRWILSTGARTEILRRMGTPDALRTALAANPTRSADPLQAMLERCILEQPLRLDEQGQEELSATLQVVEWLGDILRGLPDRAMIERTYAWEELLAPFRYLAGKSFFGRQQELAQLADFVMRPRSRTALEPLLIYAAGGMGKSSLLSKFILDHATDPDPGRRLPFVYLDFDRPGLLPEEPLTLLAEAMGQLGTQFADAAGEAAELRGRLLRLLAESQQVGPLVETRGGMRLSTHLRSVEQRSIRSTVWDRSDLLSVFGKLCDTLGISDRPLLFALDTFEEVQYLSQDFADETWEFLRELSARVPGLRPVVAGRAAATALRVGKRLIEPRELPLPPLDREAALDYLASQGVAEPRLALAIVEQVQGNPLSLKLAAAVVRREGEKPSEIGDLSAYLQSLGVTENLIQGQLYKRILSHIHDGRVRALAHPGLVLRRVTPDLIRDVLAQPCGVAVPDENTAQELFRELAREVSLVTVDQDGALVHRPDIRRMMLELLRQDEPLKVLQIDRLAVRHYAEKPGAKNRAEEIYHLLQLGTPREELDRRWMEGVEPYLRNAVEEVPRDVQHYLAARLGVTGDQFAWDEAGVADWELYAETRAKDLVSLGKLEDALRVLTERKERTPRTTLFRLEAQILEQLARWPEARRAAKEGILWSTRSHNNPVLLELLLLAARVDEKLGHYEQAAEMLSAAESLDVPLDAAAREILTFEIGVQRLRLVRLAPASVAASVDKLEAKAIEEFDDTVYLGLRQRPDLILSFIEEVGAAHPELLSRVLSLIHKVEAPDEAEQSALASALAAWDLQLSRAEAKEAGPLASAAGITPDADLRASWLAFVQTRNVDELLAALRSLARQFTPTPDVVRAIVQILRTQAPPTRGRRLTGELFDEVRSALLTVFDNRQALAGAVSDVLHADLEQIAAAEIYLDALYNLVEWAEDNGRIEDLIRAALERAPKKARAGLSQLLKRFQPGGPQPDAAPSAKEGEAQPASREGLVPVTQVHPLPMEPPPGATGSGPSALARPELVYNWAVRMREAARAVCRVETKDAMGTGFLVAPNLLLTAAYVVITVNQKEVPAHPGAVRFRFDYRHGRDGAIVGDGTVYTLAEDWLVDYELRSSEKGSGFAMLRLEGTPGSDFVPGESVPRGWLALEPDHIFRSDEPLFALGHYGGEPIQVQCLSLHKLPTPDDDVLTVSSPLGAGPGAGGGPCFSSGWQVLGLRYGSGAEDQQRQRGKLIIECSSIRRIVGRPRVAQALEEALRDRPTATPGA